MCGRFSQQLVWEQISDLYDLPDSTQRIDSQPRYNGAPTQDFSLCRLDEGGCRSIVRLHWGLVPHWSRDTKIGARLINARAETVQEKPSFRSAFRSRRCLIPANGWFEWRRSGRNKHPFFLALENGTPISFAALWDCWTLGGNYLETFTIITTDASNALSEIHDRQPAVVDFCYFTDWRDPKTPVSALQKIIQSPHEGPYEIRPISNKVNRVSNDTPDILPTQAQNKLF